MAKASISIHQDDIAVASSVKVSLRELKGYGVYFDRHNQAFESYDFSCNRGSITGTRADLKKPMSSSQT